jgi:HSP20 family protein
MFRLYGYDFYSMNGNEGCGPVFGQMMTNIAESKGEYEVEVMIPGSAKENIFITFEDAFLKVKVAGAKVANTETPEETEYIWKEFSKGDIERSIYIGEHINKDGIRAEYVNGMLTIHVPKEDVQNIPVQ